LRVLCISAAYKLPVDIVTYRFHDFIESVIASLDCV